MKTRFIILALLTVTAFFGAGCGTANFWGAKTGGAPASLGGNISIPLGSDGR